MKRLIVLAVLFSAVTWALLSWLYDVEFDALCRNAHGVTVQGYDGLICLTDQPVIAEN